MITQNIKILFLFTFFVFLPCFFSHAMQNETKGGLFFHSFETDIDKRTSLILTPENEIHLPKGFTMEFDAKFRVEVQNFGYICRIIANDTLNIDLLSDFYYPLKNKFLSLVVKQESLINFSGKELEPEMFEDWVKISLSVNPVTNRIELSLNGFKKESDYKFGSISDFYINFGSNLNKNFYTTDVAPITIRDLRIYDKDKKLVRHWELSKHAIGYVYDECQSAKAIAINPSWLIDEHIKWKEKKKFILPGLYYQFAFDPQNERIFLAKNNHLFIYYLQNNQIDTVNIDKGLPYNLLANQLVFDSQSNELITYNFENNEISRFNFETKQWTLDDNNKVAPKYWHHGKYYSPDLKKIITVGGYGLHQYSSFLQQYSVYNKKWDVIDLSHQIPPRYLGSMGYYDGQSFLYFGGFGNKSGKQEESPRNYYDLYKINLNDYSVQKIWELETVTDHFTNSNSLIVDKNRNVFYTLSYSNLRYLTSIVLHRYSLDKPEYEVLGDSIPYLFADTKSYCDLYLNSEKTKLYVLTSCEKGSDSEISIYSMAYPPLRAQDVLQPEKKNNNKIWFIIGGSLFFLLFTSFACLKIYTKKRKGKQSEQKDITIKIQPVDAPLIQLPESSIYLLGDFKVIDHDKNNISASFTPTTRQLFLLILLSTLKDGYGISSEEIKKHIWRDKDQVSARNSRNVYIQKIRNLLKDVGNIEVSKIDGYWKINLSNNVFCDYSNALIYINSLKNGNFDKNLLDNLLEITSRGTLLPEMKAVWLGDFKSYYSNSAIDVLVRISKNKNIRNDFEVLLKIANVILLNDSTEEYGIKLKCYVLLKLKRNKQANQYLQEFSDNYEKMYAVKPDITFEDIVKFRLD